MLQVRTDRYRVPVSRPFFLDLPTGSATMEFRFPRLSGPDVVAALDRLCRLRRMKIMNARRFCIVTILLVLFGLAADVRADMGMEL